LRIGYDIGGTFTDFVFQGKPGGGLIIHKVLTTPAAPATGALIGLAELVALAGTELSEIVEAVHATTLVTNAVIERRGAKLGLITTRGFRDILPMGKEQRYDIYDLRLKYPEPLVPRHWRREVGERVLASGEVLQAVESAEVVREVTRLVSEGVEAIAVCFLHGFRNPINEQVARDSIRLAFPELTVCCSHEVAPEIREYERLATTVVNGYVQPLVSQYLQDQQTRLATAGFRGRMVLMQSSGGVAAPETMREFPVRLLESGPAAGALAAAWLGRKLGLEDLISFDMGGTTAKACLIEGGAPLIVPGMEVARVHRFAPGSGLPVRTPVVDLIEIGAGGGSIARGDRLGLLKVGPNSAAADPGPACYGRGGQVPTVTDSNLLLGYLNPDYFLGGRLTLKHDAAARAMSELAELLKLDIEHTAWGIHELVTENMAAAARMHAVERGRDARRYKMLAFGGAGPIHAARVAQRLGVRTVIIPVGAGAASAFGLLVAPPSFETAVSRPVRLDQANWAEVDALFAQMEAQTSTALAAFGVAPESVSLYPSADMKFDGQIHEITVPLPTPQRVASGTDANRAIPIAEAFHRTYSRLFAHSPSGFKIQVLSWRLRAEGPAPELSLHLARQGVGKDPIKESRQAYFPEAGGWTDTLILDRYEIAQGVKYDGPCIVEEAESTTVVCPGQTVEADQSGNLWIHLPEKEGK
jgi:5-oxoprolinase (ATP-hydrolysing)/N-methylhydantoinase A